MYSINIRPSLEEQNIKSDMSYFHQAFTALLFHDDPSNIYQKGYVVNSQ